MAARSVYASEYVVTALSQTRGEAAPPEADPAGDSQPRMPAPLLPWPVVVLPPLLHLPLEPDLLPQLGALAATQAKGGQDMMGTGNRMLVLRTQDGCLFA